MVDDVFTNFKAAGRFFEPSEGESERMAAGTTRRMRHVPPSLLTQRPHSGSALVPRSGPEFPCPPSHNQMSSRDLWQRSTRWRCRPRGPCPLCRPRVPLAVLFAVILIPSLILTIFTQCLRLRPPFPRHRDPSLVVLSVFLHRRRCPFPLLSVCLAMAPAVPQMPESNL